MPGEDQIEYVQLLWDRIAVHPDRVPVPQWHLEELRRRESSAKTSTWGEVRMVRGPGANSDATVVGIRQGLEVLVECDSHGNRERRRLLWGGLRRIGPARPNESREAASREGTNRES